MRLLVIATLAVGLAGCSLDMFMLTFAPPPDQDAGPDDTQIPLGGPTYHGQVDDILAAHCWRCHAPASGLGIALDFTEASAAVRSSETIAMRTRAHTMPPFFATNDGTCQSLEATGRDAPDVFEQAVLGRWVQRGSQVGLDDHNPPATPMLPHLSGAPSTTLTPAAEFVPLRTETRCFVVAASPAITAGMFLTAFEVTPGSPSVVHNVVVYQPLTNQDAMDATALEMAAAMGTTPRVGYACEGGPGEGVDAEPIGVWTPGTGAVTYPAGTGLPLAVGRAFVLQVHYDVSNAVRATPDAGAGSDGGPRRIVPDRTRVDFVTAAAVARPARILPVAATGLALAPNEPGAISTGVANVIADGVVSSVFPLMYTRGVDLRLALHRGTIDSCMLDVRRWDLAWRQSYAYAAASPVSVTTGDTISVTCTHDTRGETDTLAAGDDPRVSEACIAYLYVSAP